MSISKDLTDTIRIQREIADKVKFENNHKDIIYICGIDVAYRNNVAYCSAVLINKNSMDVVESYNTTSYVKHPYVSGFLMLREADPIINILKFCLASYVGVTIDRPTVGVAKSHKM